MKNTSRLLSVLFTVGMIFPMSQQAMADTILVDKPRGSIVKLTQKGKPACGTVDWASIRQSGTVTIDGKQITMKEAKFPLSKTQWEQLLTRVAGDKDEITIAHAWNKEPAGLAAALRVAYDIRSYGGTAWVLNGNMGNYKVEKNCEGNFTFKGKPQQIYMSEADFWGELRDGKFMDARGYGAKEPPSYTWVVGSPKNAKVVDIASFTNDGKVDKDSFSCDVFKDVTVAGCDSVHKTFLAVEAAKYANCASQPKIMPYWGLAGASRNAEVAEKVWGNDIVLNKKRSGEIAR